MQHYPVMLYLAFETKLYAPGIALNFFGIAGDTNTSRSLAPWGSLAILDGIANTFQAPHYPSQAREVRRQAFARYCQRRDIGLPGASIAGRQCSVGGRIRRCDRVEA